MADNKKKQVKRWSASIPGTLLRIGLILGVAAALVFGADEKTDNRKLQNGSFEEGQTFKNAYSQPDQSAVPSWNTTAFQGKIELFRENTGTYIPNVKLSPTNGTYAAEIGRASCRERV